MQDAITNIINQYDIKGKYLDKIAISELSHYFNTGINRLKLIEIVISKASKIVKESASRLYEQQPELLRPGGNSYTTRRYATCLRDIDYYLRYASYAIIADNNDILKERLLDGLKETYASLNVPIGPSIISIQMLKNVVLEEIKNSDLYINQNDLFQITKTFDYISQNLSNQNI
uniref:Allophycocyanin beta 18 subunit n=1 Tax=Chondria tumulosa TaxID=2740715 RepID=A0A896SPT6_9FLOR|nr:allophycocyanin beta 18 subunit [Chondria tumulosa]QSD57072.1 allophycocyanin beta 18 subunit [Chondria tumulosa]